MSSSFDICLTITGFLPMPMHIVYKLFKGIYKVICFTIDYNLSDAIVLEELDDNLKIVVAVRTEDQNEQFAKDIKEVVESEEFHQAVEDSTVFSSFQKPEWYVNKWS
jgi:hypothetical protein